MKLTTKLVLGATVVAGLSISAFAACATDVDFGGTKKITGLADGSADGDAVNVGQLNAALIGGRWHKKGALVCDGTKQDLLPLIKQHRTNKVFQGSGEGYVHSSFFFDANNRTTRANVTYGGTTIQYNMGTLAGKWAIHIDSNSTESSYSCGTGWASTGVDMYYFE